MFQPGDELLTVNELSARLKISKHTLYELTRQRAEVRQANPLPCIRLSRKNLRFSWAAVCAWLSELQQQPR
jgi:excisionase family DNA binding protein